VATGSDGRRNWKEYMLPLKGSYSVPNNNFLNKYMPIITRSDFSKQRENMIFM
jgi:hypothetical protein